MKDTIYRQDAIEHCKKRLYESALNNVGVMADDVFSEIADNRIETWLNELPSAGKTGKWIREVLGSTSGYGTTVMYQCTNCEKMSISKYKFCPNCGTKIEREDDD